ncbi:MAG: AMP-binding protein [Verrucomicrobiota bacterium]|jgi:acyl-[acyl-carrier-protein]-phospholipid O-acyltransferase/long-chain-fatty-acid--[acyl-carrier-protein] ligase
MAIPFFRRRTFLPFHLELLAGWVARLLYRVRTSGLENLPKTGGVLLITNHITYVDVVVLQLVCPRPIRFIGYKGLRRNAFFNWCFEVSGSIPISPMHPTEGIRSAVRALKQGDLVCLCPEGHISRTGQLMEIKKGFEMIARQSGVPVVAASIDGLWGSIFSFAGNKYLWKSPRLLPTDVFIAFGRPVPAAEVSTAWARRELLDLGEKSFSARPVLRRHLGRECVRSLTKHPGRCAVVDRTAGRRELSCAQLFAAVAVLVGRIRATVPEKRVGIVLPPGAGAFIVNLAVLCAGRVPVNLNFTIGAAALRTSLRIGGISTVISANQLREKLPDFPWPERTLDLKTELDAAGGKRAMLPWLLAGWLLPNQWCADLLQVPRLGDREEAGLLFTSGSSGEPKGVVLSHRNILANCGQISSLSILPETCTLLGCLPVFHSFGFTATLWYPLLRGCRVVTIPSPLETRKIIDAIRDEEITVMLGAPTFVRPILKRAQPYELRTLDLLVTGAEKLPDDLAKSFLETFHIEILQGYGLTETTPASNINQPHPPVVVSTNEPQEGKRPGSVGRMMPGMTARIVDPETGQDLPFTATGVIHFRGANVFGGYLDDPAKTAAAFCDGWFVTGDLGRFDADGFLFIEGRLSRFSKIGGEMVPLGTVEQKIMEAFGWEQTESPVVFVSTVPDPTKGEALVLLTTQDVTADVLRARLMALDVPNLWVPKIIHRVDQIPMLGTGKTDLKRCREIAVEAVT